MHIETVQETNTLFPVFLKLEEMNVLLVGGGNVGLEKLNAILLNSPLTRVTLVASAIGEAVRKRAFSHLNVILIERAFEPSDPGNHDMVIVAVNDPIASAQIRDEAKRQGKLVNVADKPELCDFYLASVVKKGNLKIAISTNGKSPTVAKRLKEMFSIMLPEQLDDVLNNMHILRNRLNGSFSEKVSRLNDITTVLVAENGTDNKGEARWKKIASRFLFAFFFMLAGYAILTYIPFGNLLHSFTDTVATLDSKFYWMIAAGFLAQLVDGALGMGYGVICTTVLLSLGVNLPAISGSIHTAEMFSSGMSGYSHYRFGNVNKKLFKALLIPGIIGAIAGAVMLAKLGEKYADYIRPLLAAYTLILGVRILLTALRKNKKPTKVKRVGWLAGAGGFLDSFGGGGWGPLVTSTLISKGRTPRFVIGSVSITEFFVTLASALTFFGMLGLSHWQVIAGLVIGGMAGAPLAAKLSGKLPLKTMLIAVGAMVIIWSLRILIKIFYVSF